MPSYSIGFDIGTLSSKSVLVDMDGNITAKYQKNHKIQIDGLGRQEENMLSWWEEFRAAARHFLSCINRPEDIKSIGVSGLLPALCPIDDAGRPVHNAILHTDVRATEELAFCNKGQNAPISHGHMLPKILWLRNHKPDLYAQIWKILVPHSFIVRQLTGTACMDYDAASMIGGVFDEDALTWRKHRLRELGVDEALLPAPIPATHIVGTVSARAAADTGLSPATKVVAGVGDTFASMLGGGAYDAGHLMLYLGTSATLVYAEGRPENYLGGPHYGPGKGRFVGRILSFGESMTHLRSALRYKTWDALNRGISSLPPGSQGLWYFPHRKLQTARSFFGADAEFLLGFRGLHDQFHLYQAMIEGIAYNIRCNLSSLTLPVQRLNVFGGGADSPEICAILANVLGQDMFFNPKSSTAIGIAFLAALGSGEITDYHVLENRWLGSGRSICPCPDKIGQYDRLYWKYQDLREKLAAMDAEAVPA